MVDAGKTEFETHYHRYLIRRAVEYFSSLGFEIILARPWKNEPDIIIRKETMEFYVEAEYGDLRSPGKIVHHLIEWKNRKIIFLTFGKFAEKLYRILCNPFTLDVNGNKKFYTKNGTVMDYRKAGDYSKNVWIVIVPEPGTLGTLIKFTPKKLKTLEIRDLFESDLFQNCDEKF